MKKTAIIPILTLLLIASAALAPDRPATAQVADVASFTIEVNPDGDNPLEIEVDGSASTGAYTVLTWAWNDHSQSSVQSKGDGPLRHVFPYAGTFNITLRLWTTRFLAETTRSVTVRAAPAATATASDTPTATPTATATDAATDDPRQSTHVACFSVKGNPDGDNVHEIEVNASCSQGTVTGYRWTFDGSTTISNNRFQPKAKYNHGSADTFSVKLELRGSTGTLDSHTRDVTVPVPATAVPTATPVTPTAIPYVASFTLSINPDGDNPLEVEVNGAASTGAFQQYAWFWEDTVATRVFQIKGGGPVRHVYPRAGSYTLRLSLVSNIEGTITTHTTTTRTATVVDPTAVPTPVNTPVPLASFTLSVNPDGDNPLEIEVDASASTGGFIEYHWIWGTGILPVVQQRDAGPRRYTYASAGAYTITLRLVAADRTTIATTTKPVTVVDPTPVPTAIPNVAAFTFTIDPDSDNPLEVLLDASTSTGTYSWLHWNPGQGDTVDLQRTVTHLYKKAYTSPGTYTVTLELRNSENGPALSTASKTVTVSLPPTATPVTPTATPLTPTVAATAVSSFTLSVNPDGDNSLEIEVDGSASTGTYTHAYWYWGDSSNVNIVAGAAGVARHTYSSCCSFTVRLELYDSNTNSFPGTSSRDIVLTAPSATPATAATPVPTAVATDAATASFTVSINPDGDNSLEVEVDGSASTGVFTGLTWDFGPAGPGTSQVRGAGPVRYVYASAGTYTIDLLLYDTVSDAVTGNARRTITVVAPTATAQPAASFTVRKNPDGDNPLEILVDARASTGRFTHYRWNFGDSLWITISKGDPYAKFVFDAAATHLITLDLLRDGARVARQTQQYTTTNADTALATQTAGSAQFVASFTLRQNPDGDNPLEIEVDGRASTGPFSFMGWDFGDSAYDAVRPNALPRRHTYDAPGSYTVTLELWRGISLITTAARRITVPPAASRSKAQSTATPTIPPPDTCAQMPPAIHIDAPHGRPQCQRIEAWRLGMPALELDYIDAVDLWSWVTRDTLVCFNQPTGGIKFIDTAAMPRAVSDLPAFQMRGLICAIIDRPGTVVLLENHATAPAPISRRHLENCEVTTNAILNFRQSPGGPLLFFTDHNGDEIAGWLPESVALTARARTDNWFLVDYHGIEGWISAHYITATGACA